MRVGFFLPVSQTGHVGIDGSDSLSFRLCISDGEVVPPVIGRQANLVVFASKVPVNHYLVVFEESVFLQFLVRVFYEFGKFLVHDRFFVGRLVRPPVSYECSV